MKIIIEENYQQLSEKVASILLSEMLQDKRVNLDLTDGSTPQGAFDILSKIVSKNPDNFKNVHYYNHDEIEGDIQLVNEILKKQVHIPFKVQEQNIHRMDFNNPYQQIDDIENHGGLDLMLLGLGADGHFCANFPDSPKFDEKVYVYNPKDYSWYDEYCRNYGLDELKSIATFGFKMVLKARRVVVIANGLKKADAVKAILTQPISPSIPGTVLRCHPNLILMLDKEAASKINQDDIDNVSK